MKNRLRTPWKMLLTAADKSTQPNMFDDTGVDENITSILEDVRDIIAL